MTGNIGIVEMKACPFCGTDAVHVVVDDEEWEIARVECHRMTCRASGPHVDLGDFLNVEEAREAAIDAWNLRMGHPRDPIITEMVEALEIASTTFHALADVAEEIRLEGSPTLREAAGRIDTLLAKVSGK